MNKLTSYCSHISITKDEREGKLYLKREVAVSSIIWRSSLPEEWWYFCLRLLSVCRPWWLHRSSSSLRLVRLFYQRWNERRGGGRKNALAIFSTWQDVFLHWCWSHILTTNNILFAFILSRGRASTSLSGCLLTLFKSKLFKSHLAVRSNGSSMTDQGLLHNSIFFFFFFAAFSN